MRLENGIRVGTSNIRNNVYVYEQNPVCIFVVLTLKSRMSLPEDIVLIAIERKNKLLSTKATVFRNEDSQGGSTMEKNYAEAVVKHLNIALRTCHFLSQLVTRIFLSPDGYNMDFE